MDYIKQYNRRKQRKQALEFVIYIFVLLAITMALLYFVCEKTIVSGDSMLPVMENGDEIVIDKISYKFGSPKRFDIIVFKYRYLADTYYVKRIIGLPGDKVQIFDGKVYINDELLESDVYGFDNYISEPGMAKSPIVLGDDEYFVLGDNRSVSKDSREKTVYLIKKSEIVGKAFLRVSPFNRFGIIKHRK